MTNTTSGTLELAYVLVVDDEGANRYSVSKTLQKVGYVVSEAANGEEALELIARQSFDVVLTDIRMPGLDGIELLRRIREHSPEVIVILMTAYATLGNAVEALRLGAHDYLIKPSSSVDIRQSVARGVERARNLKRRRNLLDAIKSDVFELAVSDVSLPPTENQDEKPVPEGIEIKGEGANATMQLGPLLLFPKRYQISIEDKEIDLTPTEFDLLLYLAAHRGRVVTCAELVREVRGYAVDEVEAREVIRPHVSNLRRKLKDASTEADLIVNVRGIGYRLSEKAGETESSE
ncbi:MAG: response regulator transcription factor [Anaerolineae bacterium]|jgi:DNA-binding response OmpR family regulator|nr:response regulator transcription factor [Anaerolineae bacterium]